MSKESPLPPNHRRALSVAAATVERTLDEITELLLSQGKEKLTKKIMPSYTPQERAALLQSVEEMRKVNEEMFRQLRLDNSLFTEEKIVRAKLAHLWTILVDSKPEKMKGYGVISPGPARQIDGHVEGLLSHLNALMELA